VLNEKLREIKLKLAKASQKKVVRKKCDHAHALNSLETTLKSRENEYKAERGHFEKVLKEKERELSKAISTIKSTRTETELLRQKQVNTESS